MSDVLTRLLRRRATLSLPAYEVKGTRFEPPAFRSSGRFDRAYNDIRQSGCRIAHAPVYHVMEPVDDSTLLQQFKLLDIKIQIEHLRFALDWCFSPDGENYLPQLPPGHGVHLIAYVPTYLGVLQKVEATRREEGFDLETFAIDETREALGEREGSKHTYILSNSPALTDH